MTILKERIQRLQPPLSDFKQLDKNQLSGLLSICSQINAGKLFKVVSAFSIAQISAEALPIKLRSIEVCEEIVWVCWPAFGEGFQIKWNVFTERIDDLWYPSSDDIIVTAPKADWVLEISHEEEVRFFVCARGTSTASHI